MAGRGREEVESFLIRMGGDFREVSDNVWTVGLSGGEDAEGLGGDGVLVVTYEAPLVVLRANIMELPLNLETRLAVCQRLLELNATDILHGAYGVEGEEVILCDTLVIDDLDFSEFRASVESLTLALAGHADALGREALADGPHNGPASHFDTEPASVLGVTEASGGTD